MLRTQKKQSVKRCVARLAQENDALEDELAQMAECWRSTSRLMEGELMQNGLSVLDKEREDGEDVMSSSSHFIND